MIVVIVLSIPLHSSPGSNPGGSLLDSGYALRGRGKRAFAFLVKRFATDDETDKLAWILKEKGPGPLRREFERLNHSRCRSVFIEAAER